MKFWIIRTLLLALFLLLQAAFAIHQTPRQIVGLKKLQARTQQQKQYVDQTTKETSSIENISSQKPLIKASSDPDIPLDIKQGTYSQKLDHFGDSTNVTFEQRYWYSLRHYKPSDDKPTPIYVLDSGEVDASTRLPYLDHGILDILANATNGIGIVLEHRYYGKSIPRRADLGPGDVWGTDELRWLTTEQALQDNAEFVQHMTFEGVPSEDAHKLQAPNAPVISYGGSYPGAKSAFVRLLYPDLIFGSLASSAVVAAVEQFPDYFYPIAAGAPQDCVQAIQGTIAYIDSIVLGNDEEKTHKLLELFGLEELKNVKDFANLLTAPLGAFQSLNWDPSVSGGESFSNYCKALVVADQPANDSSSADAPTVVKNMAKYIRDEYVTPCTSSNETVESCFGTNDWSSYTNATELTDNNGIAWTFQFCTQWGYLMTAPPNVHDAGSSPYTFTHSGPQLVSSLLDLEYASAVCRNGFLPGKHFSVPEHPQTEQINKLGNFTISVDRLAFIDGQFDPWRPATVHSQQFAHGGARIDTLDRPFKLIKDCWHHCDENGNKTFEPPRIQQIHAEQIAFVQHWLKDFPPANATSKE